MSDFHIFKNAVAEQFDRMNKGPLFRTAVSKDEMKTAYLDAFPAGTGKA